MSSQLTVRSWFNLAAAGLAASILGAASAHGHALADDADCEDKPEKDNSDKHGKPFSFALWGDMPYDKNGDADKLPNLIADMNADHDIAFTIFDGDTKDGSSKCTDDQFDATIARFNSLKVPTVYVPGDNEWTDCHRTNNGGYDNLERLDFLRRSMFSSPDSFGQRTMSLEHQGPLGGLYAENTRFRYGDVWFVTINMPGSNNNKVNALDETDCMKKSARTVEQCQADNEEYAARDAANIAFVRETFALAKSGGAIGVMVVAQADPSFDLPETEDIDERALPAFDGYTSFLEALATETQAFGGEVVYVHGDTHYFKIDKPLSTEAGLIENFTRVETFGSPSIHWLKVNIDPHGRNVFHFDPRLVPGN